MNIDDIHVEDLMTVCVAHQFGPGEYAILKDADELFCFIVLLDGLGTVEPRPVFTAKNYLRPITIQEKDEQGRPILNTVLVKVLTPEQLAILQPLREALASGKKFITKTRIYDADKSPL